MVLPASSLVKEVAAFGGDVSGLVPDFVLGPLTERLAERRAAGGRGRRLGGPSKSLSRASSSLIAARASSVRALGLVAAVRAPYDSSLDLFAWIPEVDC